MENCRNRSKGNFWKFIIKFLETFQGKLTTLIVTVIYLVDYLTVIALVGVRMNVVSATSMVLKKLFATKTGAEFAVSYHTKCQSGTLIALLHPFKHVSKKKV